MAAGSQVTSFEELNGRHRGETVFIVGAGPQLASVTDTQARELERRAAIGVNLTFYRVRTRYFLSAYIGQAMLARLRMPSSTVMHMRPVYEPPLSPAIMPLRRCNFDRSVGLTSALAAPEPTLFTLRNVALGATHLAHVLGARRIAYVGIEQRNQLHYWHLMPQLVPAMQRDIESLRDVPFLTADHPYATYESLVRKIARMADESMLPFWKDSHEPSFREYFSILRAAGVSVVSTSPDSVVRDAGADFVPLEQILAEDPHRGSGFSGSADLSGMPSRLRDDRGRE